MIEIVSNKLNPAVIPHLHVWGWEVPIYLFMGGLAGGLLAIASGLLILKKGSAETSSVKLAALLAPIVLGVGMFFLFLDLANKLNVWRFYTAFVYTSPMSWGSWLLVIFFPASVLQAAILYREYLPKKWQSLLEKAKGQEYKLAVVNAHLGVAIGIYTGILLATYYARPLWSSGVLGFLFLLSGLSGAAAFLLLTAPKDEKSIFSKMDMYFLSLEGFALTVFIISGVTGSANSQEAMVYLISGPYAPWFWSVTVFGGLVVPLALETLESLGKIRFSYYVPLLVLMGSLSLRFIIVYAGQALPTFS